MHSVTIEGFRDELEKISVSREWVSKKLMHLPRIGIKGKAGRDPVARAVRAAGNSKIRRERVLDKELSGQLNRRSAHKMYHANHELHLNASNIANSEVGRQFTKSANEKIAFTSKDLALLGSIAGGGAAGGAVGYHGAKKNGKSKALGALAGSTIGALIPFGAAAARKTVKNLRSGK